MDINLETVKQIGIRIASIATRGKKLDLDIHFCAVQCMLHAEKHGDFTLSTRLVDAMPKSGRRKALVAWFKGFGPFNYSEEKGFSKNKTADARKFDVKQANENPFYDFTNELAVSEFTLEAALRQLKTLNTRVSKNLSDDEIVAFHNSEKAAANTPVEAKTEETIQVPQINGKAVAEEIAA